MGMIRTLGAVSGTHGTPVPVLLAAAGYTGTVIAATSFSGHWVIVSTPQSVEYGDRGTATGGKEQIADIVNEGFWVVHFGKPASLERS